jgi:hypothetical protein
VAFSIFVIIILLSNDGKVFVVVVMSETDVVNVVGDIIPGLG